MPRGYGSGVGKIRGGTTTRRIARARREALSRLAAQKVTLYTCVPTDRAGTQAAIERAAQADPIHAKNAYPDVYAAWAAGELRLWRLTIAFNTIGAVGDWVDAACGTRPPFVDLWEAGHVYPRWEELVRVSALTGTSLPDLLSAPQRWEPPRSGRCASAVFADHLRVRYHPAIVSLTTTGQEVTKEAIHNAFTEAKGEYFGPLISSLRAARREHDPGRERADREITETIR